MPPPARCRGIWSCYTDGRVKRGDYLTQEDRQSVLNDSRLVNRGRESPPCPSPSRSPHLHSHSSRQPECDSCSLASRRIVWAELQYLTRQPSSHLLEHSTLICASPSPSSSSPPPSPQLQNPDISPWSSPLSTAPPRHQSAPCGAVRCGARPRDPGSQGLAKPAKVGFERSNSRSPPVL